MNIGIMYDTNRYSFCLLMRATYDMLDMKTKCCPNPQSIIVMLYLHWFRIKNSIQTIHKQTDHDQIGFNLDGLIWDELALIM